MFCFIFEFEKAGKRNRIKCIVRSFSGDLVFWVTSTLQHGTTMALKHRNTISSSRKKTDQKQKSDKKSVEPKNKEKTTKNQDSVDSTQRVSFLHKETKSD